MLTIEGLSKTYANGVNAIGDLSLDVAHGEIIAVVGGSGCGKSTLLRMIAGLDLPTAGSIHVNGQRITAPHPSVGVVFQEPRLLPWLNVARNIGFGIDEFPRAEQEARIARALELIGLEGYDKRLPKELSGGQAQRVAIARALVAQPDVLLLDEPFSALDPLIRKALHGQMLDLWKAYRTTMIIVTHDADEAVALADRIVVMAPKPGRIHSILQVVDKRPRDPLSDRFTAQRRDVLAALDAAAEFPQSNPNTLADIGAGAWW
jgi:sulfonate transport system ATP-binding protein